MTWERDVVIVGGCGHVGLPLGLAFAERGLTVDLYDIDEAAVDAVNRGSSRRRRRGPRRSSTGSSAIG